MSERDDRQKRRGILDLIERTGNRLPDPTTLFLLGTLLVMGLSHLAWTLDWEVTETLPQPITEPVTDERGEPVIDPETSEQKTEQVLDPDTGKPLMEWRPVYETEQVPAREVVTGEGGEPVVDPDTGEALEVPVLDPETEELATREVQTDREKTHGAQSLLTRDGLFYALSSMVGNFIAFPPLGIVLVGMLGIGVAERTGLIGAALRSFMLVVPGRLLTPSMVFIGIMSSIGSDAGYVVLPPLAAALYAAVGRSPLAGLAAVFAGVSAGFSANLFVTSIDPALAEFSTMGANVLNPDYQVSAAANWWFMIASTVLITLTGWAITSLFVEKRLRDKPPEEGGPAPQAGGGVDEHRLSPAERRAMRGAGLAMLGVIAAFAALIFIPGAPLHGEGGSFPRWIETIVPILFFVFVVPGVVYGAMMKNIRSDKDVAKLLIDSMSSMAPIIVLAFFAAQFIEYFRYSGLDTMLAMSGGQLLGRLELGAGSLMVSFIIVTVIFNMFIGSMSAKYAMFAPIFIPMFMMVGVSPELTQAAYRVGDSVSNVITPLNAYLVIVLVFMKKHVPRGGIGTLIATMFPYTVGFLIVWSVLLLGWMFVGAPLGPGGELVYDVSAS